MPGVVAEFSLPADEFALYETLSTHPNAEFEVERVVAHDTDSVMPFVWVRTDEPDADAVEETLRGDPSTDEVEVITDLGDERLYQMSWVSDIQTLVHVLVEEEATVLAATGSGGGNEWDFRGLFPDRDALSTTHEFCEDSGLRLDIKRIYQLDEGRQGRYGLTDEQQTALATGFEEGYYDVPRSIALEGLAEELDLSHQALSERFRRAHKNLVENTVVVGDEDTRET